MNALLERYVPGFALRRLGRNAEGAIHALAFALSVLIVIGGGERVLRGVVSLLMTAVLLIVEPSARAAFIPDNIAEHWVAALAALAAPILLARFARRRTRVVKAELEGAPESEWAVARRQFSRNRLAVAGLVCIAGLSSVAFLCPVIAPYHPHAFQDGTVTQYRRPLSSVSALLLARDRITAATPSLGHIGEPARGWIAALRAVNAPLIDAGMSRMLFVDSFTLRGDSVHAVQDETVLSLPLSALASPDPDDFVRARFHLLGTDSYGRDVLSRIIYGSRVSLSLGLIAVLLSVTVGTVIGLLAGYFGRLFDATLMRTVDLLLALPLLFLILGVIALFDAVAVPRFLLIILVLGLTTWMGVARLVRGEVLSLREREFVTAAHALGLGHARIIFRHILPNVLTPVIVNATLRIGGIILVEAALSFLNLGVQQPTASWGSIIYEGKDVLSRAWWISAFPGIAIVVTVVCFNLVGDGLRDAIDPSLRDA